MEILAEAAAQGITFFDTADVYGAGQSESWIGQPLPPSPKTYNPARL